MNLEVAGSIPAVHPDHAPVAQWIRASVYEAEGRKFESCLVYQYMRDGAVVASESHNLRVGGSNPPPVTKHKPGCPSGSRGRSAKPVFFAEQSAKGDDVGSLSRSAFVAQRRKNPIPDSTAKASAQCRSLCLIIEVEVFL